MDSSDLYRLDGRVAVVTGAAGGIGTAISRRLAELGARVVLADVSEAVAKTARDVATEGGATDFVVFDVTDSGSVEGAVETVVGNYGRVDILVANAGISYERKTVDHSDEEWRRVMGVNLDGVFYSVRAFSRPMLKAGSGAVVAISSIAGVKVVRPEIHVGYDVSKAGVAHRCRVLAVEWAKQGVRINAVGPGYTDTEMLAEVGRTSPETMEQWLDDTPFGRLMKPQEIASGVAFLASDAASGISGHLLMVDGGYSVA
ncbi:MAG: SDR family oxidoreductase [Hyphomicrobiales bacterium]|nr:SDR family oxidoreductase [Hyphomicrobiales bacterium]